MRIHFIHLTPPVLDERKDSGNRLISLSPLLHLLGQLLKPRTYLSTKLFFVLPLKPEVKNPSIQQNPKRELLCHIQFNKESPPKQFFSIPSKNKFIRTSIRRELYAPDFSFRDKLKSFCWLSTFVRKRRELLSKSKVR